MYFHDTQPFHTRKQPVHVRWPLSLKKSASNKYVPLSVPVVPSRKLHLWGAEMLSGKQRFASFSNFLLHPLSFSRKHGVLRSLSHASTFQNSNFVTTQRRTAPTYQEIPFKPWTIEFQNDFRNERETVVNVSLACFWFSCSSFCSFFSSSFPTLFHNRLKFYLLKPSLWIFSFLKSQVPSLVRRIQAFFKELWQYPCLLYAQSSAPFGGPTAAR